MRRFRKEFGLKKARILRERLIPVSQRLKIGINRHLLFSSQEKCTALLTAILFYLYGSVYCPGPITIYRVAVRGRCIGIHPALSFV